MSPVCQPTEKQKGNNFRESIPCASGKTFRHPPCSRAPCTWRAGGIWKTLQRKQKKMKIWEKLEKVQLAPRLKRVVGAHQKGVVQRRKNLDLPGHEAE